MWGRVNMLPRSCQRVSPPAFAEAATRRHAFLSAHRAHNSILYYQKVHSPIRNEVYALNYVRFKNENPEGIQFLYAKANAEPQSGSTSLSK